MKKGIKLLTAWTLSALMTISTFSVAFADDTASETVSADEVTLAGTMTGNTLTSGNFSVPSASVGSVADDGSLELNAIQFLPYVIFGGKENPTTPGGMFAASDKYAISFDVKTPFTDDNDPDQKSIFIIADYDSNKRIGYFELYKSQIKFGKSGKDLDYGGNVAYSINTNDWVNVKAVIYPKKETADNNRIEWYINENLICVTASNSNMASQDRVAKQILVNTPAGLKINNLKLEAVTKKNDINKGNVTEQSTIIGNQNKVHKTVTGIMQTRNGRYDIDSEGIYPTEDVDLFLVTEDTLEFYDKYSVSFDVKTKSSETESDGLLTSVNLLDKNYGYKPGNESATTPDTYACFLGFFNLYRNKIEFSTNGGTGAALTEYSIRPGEWVNVEYVVSPSKGAAGKTTDFSWYVNGKLVCSGTVANSWEKSKTGILKKFNPTGVTKNTSRQFWFDNFSINAIDTVKHYNGLLIANASVNNGKLEVVFSKSVADEAIAKNVVIKDSENEVITPSSVSLSADKKTLTIDIPGGATAEYYSVQLPERLTDTDSLIISNPTVYTPHLGLTNAQIIKNGASGNFSLKTAYDNTNNEDAEIFAVIVAYDKTTNALIRADFAKYTVPANGTYTPETLPTISAENSENTTVKAFIWRQTSLAPICDVIPYRAN